MMRMRVTPIIIYHYHHYLSHVITISNTRSLGMIVSWKIASLKKKSWKTLKQAPVARALHTMILWRENTVVDTCFSFSENVLLRTHDVGYEESLYKSVDHSLIHYLWLYDATWNEKESLDFAFFLFQDWSFSEFDHENSLKWIFFVHFM